MSKKVRRLGKDQKKNDPESQEVEDDRQTDQRDTERGRGDDVLFQCVVFFDGALDIAAGAYRHRRIVDFGFSELAFATTLAISFLAFSTDERAAVGPFYHDKHPAPFATVVIVDVRYEARNSFFDCGP
jgi:hypothetical protein